MSFLESLSLGLATMGFLQLGLALLAIACYALAINGSLSAKFRCVTTLCSFGAAAGFSALTPSWMGGLALMLMAVLVMAAFAAATWLLAAAFDLDTAGEPSASRVRESLPAPVPRPRAAQVSVPAIGT